MRNIFDQYSQPENRLTHSLATVLHQDRKLLSDFLKKFGPRTFPSVHKLKIIEQSIPGRIELAEGESLRRGLPDAVIFDDAGWALVIESKINDTLKKEQLNRHFKTIRKCGFENVAGLAITRDKSKSDFEDWKLISWKDVYSWGSQQKSNSQWAKFMVDYFNVAETKMADDGYLKEGTITEFSGISFDPYTYLEGKRVLRLLTQKLRDNRRFVNQMGLDASEGRSSITEQARLWDFLRFKLPDGVDLAFHDFPHCTVGIGPEVAEAMITFPHGMSTKLRKRLHRDSFEEFAGRLQKACTAVTRSLPEINAYSPIVRVQQRRYKTQRSVPFVDGKVEFDLRTILGERDPHFGPRIKPQKQWAQGAYELLRNKKSNIQFQIGAMFLYNQSDELNDKTADRYFANVFKALRPFVGTVID